MCMGMCFNGFSKGQFGKTSPLSCSQHVPAGQLSDSSLPGPSSSPSCLSFPSLLPAFPMAAPCSPSPGLPFCSYRDCGKRPHGSAPTPDPPWPHAPSHTVLPFSSTSPPPPPAIHLISLSHRTRAPCTEVFVALVSEGITKQSQWVIPILGEQRSALVVHGCSSCTLALRLLFRADGRSGCSAATAGTVSGLQRGVSWCWEGGKQICSPMHWIASWVFTLHEF